MRTLSEMGRTCWVVIAATVILTSATFAQTETADELKAAAASWEAAATSLESAATAYADDDGQAVHDHLKAADTAADEAQKSLGIDSALRSMIYVFVPKGHSTEVPTSFRSSATAFRKAAELYRQGKRDEADDLAFETGFLKAEKGYQQDAYVTDPFQVFACLLATLAVLFLLNSYPAGNKFFRVIPLLVFCYFVPTILSNLGLIPIDSPAYTIIKKQLLPASLFLLVLAVDIPAIFKLGRSALVLFFTATISIVIGGPIALFLCQGIIPEAMGDQAWKGLAALAGSWIGGGANFVAIGESVGTSASTMSMMVVVDVAVAEIWMIALLFFAGREKQMDEKIGADRSAIDEVRERIEAYEKEVSRPTNLPDLLTILALAFGVTAIATALSGVLPSIGSVVRGFTWIVIIVTTVAVILSFTKVRRLEGAGASKLGSVFLYLLVASIGAHAQFSKVMEAPSLFVVGAVWMMIHIVILLGMRRFLKAPIFFAAVGSKANIGGAASAPILASAFHPSLAPVGILLAVGGYVLGTYAGLLTAYLLELVS